jgi:hypothetical protein
MTLNKWRILLSVHDTTSTPFLCAFVGTTLVRLGAGARPPSATDERRTRIC